MKQILLTTLLLSALLVPNAGKAETFLVTADFHLTSDAASFVPPLNALANALRGRDALLALGDITNNARAAEHQAMRGNLYALKCLTGAKVYALPGNHDIANDFDPSAFAAYYVDYGWNDAWKRDFYSASYAVMTKGGTCLIMLDTFAVPSLTNARPEGGVADATLNWLDSLLTSLAPDAPVIVCGHHPILPAEQRNRMENAPKLANVLRRRGVSLYLCGHDHCFAAVKEDGLQQITVGQPQNYPGGVGLLTVDAQAIRWRMLPLYADNDPYWQSMVINAREFRDNMGRKTLVGTPHEDDAVAIDWFCRCFDLFTRGELDDALCKSLLSEPGAQMWREIETKTIVKRWLFGLLEGHPQSVREIIMPLRIQ